MGTFQNFKEDNLELVALRYFTNTLTPNLTLAEVRDILTAEDIQRFLPGVTLGQIRKDQPTQQPAHHRKPSKTIANLAVSYLCDAPNEYTDAHDIAEAVGSSPEYINRVLQLGIQNSTLPISMQYRRGPDYRGKGLPTYRYVAGWDS